MSDSGIMDGGTSQSNLSETNNMVDFSQLKSYKIRWLIVIVLALLNGTNAYLWVSFAPVANYFIEFYSTTETVLNMVSLIFPLSTILLGFPSAWLVDKYGVRFVLMFSAGACGTCGILRCISSANSFDLSPEFRLSLVVVGQVISSVAQPLCMFAPTALALDWFPDGQRTIANTIGSLGNPLGVLAGSALAPVIVKKSTDFVLFNYITLGIVLFGILMTLFAIRRNKPLQPPSLAAAVVENRRRTPVQNRGFLQECLNLGRNIIEPLKSPGFWILMLSFGSALAYFTMLSTLFQQILCTKGYSNEFAGLCGSIMIGAGLVASGPAAIIVDKTGRLLEAVKICFTLAVLGGVGLSVALWYSDQRTAIVFCVVWLGIFGFSQYSVSLELAAESTFPVPETITTAILIVFSQILSILFIVVMQFSAASVDPSSYDFKHQTCGASASPQDYTIPNMVICGLMTFLAIFQLFGLKLPYKRRDLAAAIAVPIESIDPTSQSVEVLT